MTSERRFEQDLPQLLAELAQGPTPDYRGDIVQQTVRMRQRPAWTFPERWLPMTTVSSRFTPVPNVPWRTVGLLAALLAALVAGAVFVAGSPTRLPAPFGPAANGVVAYAAGGDIYTVDPVSGVATAVVTGPETDAGPVWSRDGTQIVFVRGQDGEPGAGWLYVARADGKEIIRVTPEPLVNLHRYSFSPDGQRIVFLVEARDGARTMWTANADGSGATPFVLGMEADWPAYRPGGAEILFAGQGGGGLRNGIYAIDVETNAVRTIVEPSIGPFLESLSWSPDGSQIAFVEWTPDPGGSCSKIAHVVRADGTGGRTLPSPSGATCDDPVAWSNDGTRLLVSRGTATGEGTFAIVPADFSGPGIESDALTSPGSLGGLAAEWAPDDSVILATPLDASDAPQPQLLIDALTGTSQAARWATTSQPTWQRRAP